MMTFLAPKSIQQTLGATERSVASEVAILSYHLERKPANQSYERSDRSAERFLCSEARGVGDVSSLRFGNDEPRAKLLLRVDLSAAEQGPRPARSCGPPRRSIVRVAQDRALATKSDPFTREKIKLTSFESLSMIAVVLLSVNATQAIAQAAPGGVVENACIGVPDIPEAMRTYIGAKLDPTKPPPSAAIEAAVAEYKVTYEKQKSRDWGELCRYAAADEKDAVLPPSRRRIVYMGDSLTKLWETADPAFFTGGRINRGVSGQTTGQMLVRFEADVIALHPRAVHIWAGVNDLAGNNGPETMADIHNNIAAMVTLARANHIRVIIASLPPVSTFPWRPELRPAPQAKMLNAWLKAYAMRVGATYVDYHKLLVGPDGATQPAFTFDTLHLTLAGYARIHPLSEEASR